MKTKPFAQMILEMRCHESMLLGGIRVGSPDNHSFIVEQLQIATESLTEFDHLPQPDRYWGDEMIADETYFALETAIEKARKYIRSTFKQVNR